MITRVASNGSVRTGRGSNRSGSSCRHTIASPLALRTTASRRHDQRGHRLAARRDDGDRQADAEIGRRVLDRELHDRGMLLQRAAEALERAA